MRVVLLFSSLCLALPPARGGSAEVTLERIAALPAEAQPAWREYLARSREQMAADQFALYAELERERLPDWTAPSSGRGVESFLSKPADWFRTDEARQLAEIVMSFQTPSGGWSKGLDLRKRPRLPGERFSTGSGWSYVGTFDNGATITELRFLSRAASMLPEARSGLLRGLEYLLRAQFPSGGWPQVYPLMGGYHDAITLNDTAMVNVLQLLRDVAEGRGDFADIAPELKARAATALQRGIENLCAMVIHGTGWAQQHDAITLAPVAARTFEPVALASAETAGAMRFLMGIETPSADTIAVIHGAAAWLARVQIKDTGQWARFHEIGTDRPLFGDRDGSIHYDVREISEERREGYAWFSKSPAGALKAYAKWSAKFPLKP